MSDRFNEIDPFDLEDEVDDLYYDGEELDEDLLYALYDEDEYEELLEEDSDSE